VVVVVVEVLLLLLPLLLLDHWHAFRRKARMPKGHARGWQGRGKWRRREEEGMWVCCQGPGCRS
jgi:hypothetical protein